MHINSSEFSGGTISNGSEKTNDIYIEYPTGSGTNPAIQLKGVPGGTNNIAVTLSDYSSAKYVINANSSYTSYISRFRLTNGKTIDTSTGKLIP